MVSTSGYGFNFKGTGFANTTNSRNIIVKDSYVLESLTIGNKVLTKSTDNNWDGFSFDHVTESSITNSVATSNGRHGIYVVTASTNIVVDGNYAAQNGYFKPGFVGKLP
jgi:parallel beta-helix repeat protein